MSEQWKKMDTITSCIESIPQLVKSIDHTMNDMGNFEYCEYKTLIVSFRSSCAYIIIIENIKTLISDVEHQLLKLEDVVEEQELQEQMLNERFQLAVYRSKKLKELEKISGINHTYNSLTLMLSATIN